jgi:cytochrome c oxidase cbb3-type subunit II
MSFRTFILSLSASFGVAWLAIVIVPYFKMRALEPVAVEEGEGTNAVFIPKRAGRITDGAQIYAENGCYHCHTQLVRPTYAGNDMFRPDWGGIAADEDRGDTRRETNAFDFAAEDFAQIGVARIGPDLSNLGRRVEAIYAKGSDPEQWLYDHLYNPRWKPDRRKSSCPSFRFLFEVTEVKGNPSDEVLPFPIEEGMEITPTADARALVSYLLSLKKDQTVPSSLDFAPAKAEVPAAAAAPAESAP